MDLVKFLRTQWDRALGWALIGGGGLALLLGYDGIRHSRYVAAQLSYLASGGIGGLWLLGVGATLLVNANLGDEWRKLDEVKELIERVLETEPSPRVDVVRAATRFSRARSGDPGSADPASVLVTALVLALTSAVIVGLGWGRAHDTARAHTAFEAVALGAAGLVVLGGGAAITILRVRRTMQGRAASVFSPFATAAGFLAVDDEPVAGSAPAAKRVRLAGSRWVHVATCPIVSGHLDEATNAVAGRNGSLPCPLCRP